MFAVPVTVSTAAFLISRVPSAGAGAPLPTPWSVVTVVEDIKEGEGYGNGGAALPVTVPEVVICP